MNHIFQKCINLAYSLFSPEHKPRTYHISFLIYKKRIICYGINSKRTHKLNLKNRKFGDDGQDISQNAGSCSELNLLLRAKKTNNINFKKCIIINIRIGRNKQIMNSKPCIGCASLLNWFRPKSVFYTTQNGNFEEYLI